MKFNEFKSNVIKWAKERKIIPNSTFDAQYIKLVEELGELALGIRKRDEIIIKDSIGDVAVVSVILVGLAELDDKLIFEKKENMEEDAYFKKISCLVGMMSVSVSYDDKSVLLNDVKNLIRNLDELSRSLGLNFMECCEYAWNEIKDRKGYLREDGIFIKEADYKQPEPTKINKGE